MECGVVPTCSWCHGDRLYPAANGREDVYRCSHCNKLSYLKPFVPPPPPPSGDAAGPLIPSTQGPMTLEAIEPKPARWEYCVDTYYGDIHALVGHLDSCGKDGWEAFNVVTSEVVREHYKLENMHTIYFKRPIRL